MIMVIVSVSKALPSMHEVPTPTLILIRNKFLIGWVRGNGHVEWRNTRGTWAGGKSYASFSGGQEKGKNGVSL